MFIPIGSVKQMKRTFLQSASRTGMIREGTYVKFIKYDDTYFYVQRCSEGGVIHKNSHLQRIGRYKVAEYI